MTIIELKEYIFNNKKIEYILEKLNCHSINFHSNNNYYSAAFPDGDNTQGITITNNSYLGFHSYSRSQLNNDIKDIIDLVKYITGKNFIDSVKYIHELLNINYIFQKKQQSKIEKIDPLNIFKKHLKAKRVDVSDIQTLDEDLLNDFVPLLHIDWYREGVMPWTRNKFGLAYSYKRKRVVIPIRHWLTKELVGFNMRTTVTNYEEFNISKYWITPSYQKSGNLYGLAENYDSIQQSGHVVIAESEKSVLKRDSLCDETVVALSGKSISDEQVRILIGLNVEIVIALDKDVSLNEIRFMCEKFYRIRPVSYIYDKYGLLKNKEAPMDASNKIYNYLFKYRTKYTEEEHQEYLKSLKKE